MRIAIAAAFLLLLTVLAAYAHGIRPYPHFLSTYHMEDMVKPGHF